MFQMRKWLQKNGLLMLSMAVLLMSVGCGTEPAVETGGAEELLGAGATFPYPLYSKMFDEYHSQKEVQVNYQAIGSGGGIRQLIEKTVDFGATDAFMSEEEMKTAGAPIIHVPTCLGAVVISYQLPGNPTLKLTPDLIAGIFLGQITEWNDSKIAKQNPGLTLPSTKISVVHRSDGSGTTYIFSDYLSKVNDTWKSQVGTGKSLNWPVGLGAKGNAGVAGLIQQVPGALGYIELTYAVQNSMPVATIQNQSGNFIVPNADSVSQAANINLPADTRVSLTNTSAPQGYPISSFTWLIAFKEQGYGERPKDRALAVRDLLSWVIHQGQSYAAPLHYAPLPPSAVSKAEAILKSMTFDKQPLG